MGGDGGSTSLDAKRTRFEGDGEAVGTTGTSALRLLAAIRSPAARLAIRHADVRGRAEYAWWHACVVLGTHAHSTRVWEVKVYRQGRAGWRKVLTIGSAVAEGTTSCGAGGTGTSGASCW
jgi:hypothetical protein